MLSSFPVEEDVTKLYISNMFDRHGDFLNMICHLSMGDLVIELDLPLEPSLTPFSTQMENY